MLGMVPGQPLCWAALLLLLQPPPSVSAERWISTLSGDYLMLDSTCSSRETDGPSGLRIGVLRQPGADLPSSEPNLMIALGGGGHTRESYEDLAARVYQRILPDCVTTGREPRVSLHPQRSPSVPRPDISPHPCAVASERPWVVVGAAVTTPGESFATPEGCKRLVQLARSLQGRWNTTRPVHLAGASAGGIAALECVAQHPKMFASATAFAGFLESADEDGAIAELPRSGAPAVSSRALAAAALRGKPVRIYVGDNDRLFHELAEEQFGEGGTVMSPDGCGGTIVRVLRGVGHELLSELDLVDLCSWMAALAQTP